MSTTERGLWGAMLTTLMALLTTARVTAAGITIKPMHTIWFEESPDVASAAFAPDGSVVYVHLRPEVIDAWDVAVQYWPETLGVISLGLTLMASLLIWRVIRRPRQPGEPYCRQCNYLLRSLPEVARCPECGVDLARRRPVKGRSLVRRLTWRIAPAAILLALYVGLWAGRTPRGAGSGWVDLASPELLAWAQENEIAWLADLRTRADRIVLIDPVDGKRIRNLCTRTGSTRFPLMLTPDGRTLFLASRGSWLRIDSERGRVRGIAQMPSGNVQRINGQTVLGFTEDGGTAFVACVEGEKNWVLAWDLTDDSTRIILEEDAYVQNTVGQPRAWPRRYALLNRNETPDILSVPSYSEANDLRSYDVRLHWNGTDEPDRITLAQEPSALAKPLVTPDGCRVFLTARRQRVLDLDLTGQRSLRQLQAPIGGSFVKPSLAMDPTGRWLLIDSVPDQILVYDLLQERWVGRLEHPSDLIIPCCVISPGGRWAAAVGYKTASAPATKGVCGLLLYDLSALHATVATGDSLIASDAP